MSLGTINTSEIHARLDEAPPRIQEAVNAAYAAVAAELRSREFFTCGDDRAEELAAAIYHYIQRCYVP